MSFPYTFPFVFDSYIVSSSDAGSGLEANTLVALSAADSGDAKDNLKIFTGKTGSDIKLHTHRGQVSITHKEVNL